jgi:hypothetical protein
MMIREEAKNLIIENANESILTDEERKAIFDKREYFQTNFSKEKVASLNKEHFFQGNNIKESNFTYELEWNSKILGGIGGGSVYKFGYEEDFDKIKKLLVKIISASDSLEQFYTEGGDLSEFSKEIASIADGIKGVARVFIGKVLSIYFPEIFIKIFGHQDGFLEKIYIDYKPEYRKVELYLRNNYLLLDFKNKYVPNLSNDEFCALLYKIFPLEKNGSVIDYETDESKIDALEVQHYQTLIHRNFKKLFGEKLKYYDLERQNEKNGQFDTQEVGIMDFLAIDEKKDLVVIELKRDSTDTTLGQILRYMGWVNKNLCGKNQKVKGIIIAESKDNRLEYALSVAENVIFRKMNLSVRIEEL